MNRVCCTRLEASGTYSVFNRLSIRWRLAVVSAGLTFLILCAFAVIFGELTSTQIRSDFVDDTSSAADRLEERLSVTPRSPSGYRISPPLELYGAPNNATIRLFWGNREPVPDGATPGAAELGPPVSPGIREFRGYLVATRYALLSSVSGGQPQLTLPVWIEYARPLEDLDRTVSRLWLILLIGVLGGAMLALLGGLALARRSLRPITDLTAAAQEITRTRDPDLHVPQPETDDEVAELARTFDEMLSSLDDSRQETEGALSRQREFVADASHELRTPLTSILANLELLSDELDGDRKEAADAALRSSQRMRRIVADLLLLARSDGQQTLTRRPLDLASVVREAVAEAEALTDDHVLTVEAEAPTIVIGDRDELHRLVTNLTENAIRHTPAATAVVVAVAAEGSSAVLSVSDNGPGIAPEQRARIFERFVRRDGDRGGSSGLGLAIVRSVAEAHGGSVAIEDADPGSRFVVRLPLTDGDET
ncbi:MAG: HAMP domain-containing protein [Actinobacteria bacterium]|uniref:histidine kinase n=1 Tax=freshwater metagenome TaxID=449393 RepID=A0A6J5Z6A5_9ZZZZ|nr:HAMP domain-containing protein [Actinomycetota bacterium]